MKKVIKFINLLFYIIMLINSFSISIILFRGLFVADFRYVPATLLIIPSIFFIIPMFILFDFIDYKLGVNAKLYYNAFNDSKLFFNISMLYAVLFLVSIINFNIMYNFINIIFIFILTLIIPFILNITRR